MRKRQKCGAGINRNKFFREKTKGWEKLRFQVLLKISQTWETPDWLAGRHKWFKHLRKPLTPFVLAFHVAWQTSNVSVCSKFLCDCLSMSEIFTKNLWVKVIVLVSHRRYSFVICQVARDQRSKKPVAPYSRLCSEHSFCHAHRPRLIFLQKAHSTV